MPTQSQRPSTGLRSDQVVDLRRVLSPAPEREDARDRTGVLFFITILFGLVVTATVADLADELVEAFTPGGNEIIETRVAHLLVALVTVVLSWIAYYKSTQHPPFVIRFVNLPLWMFTVEVATLVTYYLLVATAERDAVPDVAAAVHNDAWPEAALVAVVFGLYGLWELLAFRLLTDPGYRSQVDDPPDLRSDPRRAVTALWFGVAVLTMLMVLGGRPRHPAQVLFIDTWLIGLLITYRLARQAVSRQATIRSDAAPPPPPVPNDPKLGRRREPRG